MDILTGVGKSNVVCKVCNPNRSNAVWNDIRRVQALGGLGNAGVVNSVLDALLDLGVAIRSAAVWVDPELIRSGINGHPN